MMTSFNMCRWPRLMAIICLFSATTTMAQLALIRQGPESVGTAEADDWHGWAVALGDFNGDGYADLAAGAPLEKTASEVFSSGIVMVNPGSAHGLTWKNAYSLSVIDGSLEPSENHQMGRALAVGDFNADGYDDLAVGLPGSTVNGQSAAGRVLVYYGGPTGLPGTASVIHQGMLGAAVESGDLFGYALGAGRLGDDIYDDLVIAATGENEDRGAVFVIRGGALGLNLSTTQILLGEDLGHPNQPGDRFGSAIAVGNIVGFPGGELIVGAPFAELTPSAPASGIVYIANSSDGAVATSNVQIITPITMSDQLFNNGRFGAALCIGDFWGDTNTRDLAIGAPGNHGGGRVYVGRGTPLGISWSVTLKQNESGSLSDEAGDDFGAALAAGDLKGNGYDELAVGTPGEDFELAFDGDDTGAVHIFHGGEQGLSQQSVDTWWTFDLGDQFIQRAWLGHSLAAGRTSAALRDSFVAGAPRRDDDRGQVFDIAPWRQVTRLLCQSAVAADCEDNIVYALRPFDKVKVASTTKIMTVLLGCEATARPLNDPLRVGLNEEYTIEPWMYEAYPPTSGCSIFGFTELPPIMQESFTFEDLFHACIMPSGNDAAYAIADAMTGEISAWGSSPAPQFVQLMNDRAVSIGMNDTFFTNPAGTDGGNPYSTAYDMWLLARTAMQNSLFREVVNTTSYLVDKFVLGNEAGMYNVVNTEIKYGWLTSMKNRDSRIIGLKPGGTPGAKSTGVVAARYDAAGNKIAFATGFRWFDSSYGRDKLAALVQLGLAFCNTDVQTPDGLSFPPGPTSSSPLARGTFHYGTTNISALQLGSFDTGEPAPQDPETSAGSLGIIDLHAFAHSSVTATAGLTWKYRAFWEMPAGSTAGLRIQPVVGGTVRLHLPTEENGASASATLRLSGTLHPSAPQSVMLPAGEDYLPPAWNDFSIAAGPVELVIANGGREPILLSLDASFDLAMNFGGRTGGLFEAQLEPLMASVRSGHFLCRGDSTGNSEFDVELIVENRQDTGRYIPPVLITKFDRQMSDSRPTEQLSLNFDMMDWDWPIDSFIQEFIIESAHSPDATQWEPLGRIPAGRATSYRWQDDLAPQEQRYLRVRSEPLPLER